MQFYSDKIANIQNIVPNPYKHKGK